MTLAKLLARCLDDAIFCELVGFRDDDDWELHINPVHDLGAEYEA